MSGLFRVLLLLLPLVAVYSDAVWYHNTSAKKWYFVDYSSRVTFWQAWHWCRRLGMTVATIESDQEENFILSSVKDSLQMYWISAHSEGDPGTFKWASNGKPLSYTKWQPGEPNNPSSELCAESYKTGWNNVACSATKIPICDLKEF